MKNIILIIVALIFIIGCSNEQSKIKTPQKNNKVISDNESISKITQNEQDSTVIDEEDSFKIALIFPSKEVGKYAKDTINTMTVFMLSQKIKFTFEVFNSHNQDISNMNETFSDVYKKGFKNVVVLYTQESLDNLSVVNDFDKFNIYLPLINKNESKYNFANVVYGGIDYEAQIKKLLTLSNNKNSIFYSDTNLGFKLKNYIENSNTNINVVTKIDQRNNEFKRIVEENGLNRSTLFLNTPIIKSSILLSQLRAYDTIPYIILSTQLNYTPLVISLTQFQDRRNFVIANSIENIDLKLQENLALLDIDVAYNWVNYSTLIGIDAIVHPNESILFPKKIIDNQVQYGITLHKNTRHGFKKLTTN